MRTHNQNALHILGSKFLCSVLVAPVKNENNDVILFILNLEDITHAPTKTEVSQNNLRNSKWNNV